MRKADGQRDTAKLFGTPDRLVVTYGWPASLSDVGFEEDALPGDSFWSRVPTSIPIAARRVKNDPTGVNQFVEPPNRMSPRLPKITTAEPTARIHNHTRALLWFRFAVILLDWATLAVGDQPPSGWKK